MTTLARHDYETKMRISRGKLWSQPSREGLTLRVLAEPGIGARLQSQSLDEGGPNVTEYMGGVGAVSLHCKCFCPLCLQTQREGPGVLFTPRAEGRGESSLHYGRDRKEKQKVGCGW